uniref:Ycf54 protein n=1 Tax=Gronococcus sybilensis TaxID=3028029 RepID=A0A9Y1I2G1_9RHOD|nr:hypothetical protein GRSY_039 [Gronococcus sybilensis]
MTNYYFAIASTKFLVEEEPLEEILRERTQYYLDHNKNIDFWVVNDPKFIYRDEFQNLFYKIPKPFTAIISTDKSFIHWIQLRVAYVKIGSFQRPEAQANDITL